MSKKKGRPRSQDRHLSHRMVRLREDIHQLMKDLAEENNRPLTREIQGALLKHLEAHGKWPPGSSTSSVPEGTTR